MDSDLYLPDDNNNNKNNNKESPPIPNRHYQLERKRWLILLIYCMGSQLQGLVWVTFSTVSTVSLTYYSTPTNKHFTDATLDLLLNYGPIAYIPAVFLAMYLLNQSASQGLRRTVQLGALFVASGACLRCIPCFFSEETRQTSVFTLVLLHISQFLNGLAGPMWMATPSALSAIWFAPSERTVATAIGSLSNNFGPTLAFLLALPVVNSSGMEWLLFSEAIVAFFTFLSIFFFFPSLPKTPPSAAAEHRLQDEERRLLQFSRKEEEEGELLINHARKRSLGEKSHPVNSSNSQARQVMIQYLWDMWALLKDSSLMLLVFSSGVASGVFNVWSGSIGVILQGVISDGENKWLGFVTNCSGILGSLVLGQVAESFFRRTRKFKLFMIILYAFAGVTFCWFTLSLPVGWLSHHASSTSPSPSSSSSSSSSNWSLLPSAFGSLIVSSSLASFFLGGTTPISYEVGAELTFPISEGSSAGFITLGGNLGGLVLLLVMPKVPQDYVNSLMTISTLVCIGALMFIRSEYRRSDVDAAQE